MLKRDWLRLGMAGFLALTLALGARAGEWPERPIRLIVPYPAGGLTDVVSRVLADEVGKVLGTSVVVENRVGAGGQIGLQALLQAPRDGYTIGLVVPATMVTLPLTNPDYKIKPLEDFAPITIAVNTYLTLVSDPRLGLKTVGDLVAHARKDPGKLNVGIPGMGTSFHFNNALMAGKLGIEPVYVPYQGEVQVLNDVAGGLLQYALVSNAGKVFIDGGKVTPLAVASNKRVSPLPNVPTFKELGVDFASDGWVGYAAAAGTPAPILAKLNASFVKALKTPAVAEKFAQMGYSVVANSPAAFRAEVQDSMRTYGELLRKGIVKVDK